MKEKEMIIYKCDNCRGGFVYVEVKQNAEDVEATVKKCNQCKRQYYIKELQALKPIKP